MGGAPDNPEDAAAAAEGAEDEPLLAPAVPGIPEAPAALAKEQAADQKDEEEEEVPRKEVLNAVQFGDDGHPEARKEGLHIAVLVEEGEEARLACHYCQGPGDQGQWVKVEVILLRHNNLLSKHYIVTLGKCYIDISFEIF